MKATQAAVNTFKMPRYPRDYKDRAKAGQLKSDHIEFFEGMPGFGLRIRRAPDGSEHRTYIYQYKSGGLHFRLNLGSAANLPFNSAKAAYQSHLGDKARGNNPAEAIRRKQEQERTDATAARIAKAAKTLSDHVADYLDWKRHYAKPRSFEETKRLLEKDYWQPLHGLQLKEIDRTLVATRLREITKKHGAVPASHARIALSHFFKWAVGEGLCDANPVIGTNRPATPRARDKVLTDAELAAIWKAAPASDYGRIVKLLMLTGQRRDEIGSLRWSEIDAAARLVTLPPERLKNGNRDNAKPHTVPLSAGAVATLAAIPRRAKRDLVFGDGEGGFSGWSAAKRALDRASGVTDWRLHDLRRTAATRMADHGVAPHIIEMVLNHISGFRGGVAGVYNRAEYVAEKRAALDTLNSYIKTAVAASEGGNVRRLPRKVRTA
jgi:integrase